jgi:hypothetical protein
MTRKRNLQLLFASILLTMLAVTINATAHQPVWNWGGLTTEPDRWWTIATLADAYCGFLTFCAWLFYKERTSGARAGWFVAIMLLGNIAMAGYVLIQLAKLRPGDSVERLLLRSPASAPAAGS